jgi:outer membrane protein assembly factor BamE (lipoprotein component of BamABCDE complex)
MVAFDQGARHGHVPALCTVLSEMGYISGMQNRTILFTALILCVVLALLSGCLITNQSNTTHTGTNVSQSTFDQIKAGSTTIGWVHATLGEPTSKTVDDGDDEVWKYSFTEHTDSSGSVFLIFGGASSNEKTNTVFIEFKSGIVINKWRG